MGQTANGDTKFQVGTTSDAMQAGCCGYGDDGKKGGFDCLQIPDAKTSDDVSLMDKNSNPGVVGAFCGFAGLGNIQDKTKDATGFKQTICSKRAPFMVRFATDSFEYDEEAANEKGTKGFRLLYKLL